ncbi:MAG: hypothetical protein COV46_07160 [Deltaproteobacteria bacterium CG11_big_fil_rev_8_21_14_0_20_49_13]|nr:MAG: hypothetical protein COV46_07160 [Deltaproteobacteria bacterium CG11_big_fil_rev_8_21_14_0_20_49_13]
MKMQKDKRAHRNFSDVFGRIGQSDFVSWTAFKVSPILGWIGFIILCTVITFLMTFSITYIPDEVISGAISQNDIRADRNYDIVDTEATNKFKEEALKGVAVVYDFDPELAKGINEGVSRAFETARKSLVEGESPAVIKSNFESALNIKVPDHLWTKLAENNFGRQAENVITSQVSLAMNRYVIGDASSILSDKSKGFLVLDPKGKEKLLGVKELAGITVVDDLRKKIKESKQKGGLDFSPIISELVQPNLAYNLQESESRKKAATENVKNVVIKVDAGETIIRVGSRYEPRHVIILNGIRSEKSKTFTPFKVIGTLILVALVILSTYYFAERYIKKFAPHRADLYFMGSVLIFILLLLRLSLGLSRALYHSIGVDIPLTAFYYAIPVGGAAMLIRFILNSETALVFSVVVSIFAGVFVGNSLNYTGYCLISCVAAAASIAYADKRSAIFKAGIHTSVINIFAAISIQMVNGNSLTETFTATNLFWYISFAIIGGISCSILVSIITPLVEHVFGYTTDIKLLELANLNHPLLRELVIRAPGTYHHSHLVGILGETAAEAIGANPLLTRVAAYYHDIGKIRKPLYFVENTTDCESRHEKLTPHMSALIVASHVKDGMELAADYNIPQKIADMIPQHHGTKMISFFFNKALKDVDPALQKIDEKDFRYHGPKPQTREAGILLLADAVEAAVRSLKEKSPARIQQMVEDIINTSFTGAQLDECDLTLKNLHDIAKSFTKILMGIYHQRIEYPKETLEENGKNGNSV